MGKRLFDTDYNYKIFEYKRKILDSNHNVIREKVVIAVKFERKKDKSYILDPVVNSFIKEYFWLNDTPLNTQKQIAKPICSFLNYCRLMVIENTPEFVVLKNGLTNLKLIHAAHYLTHQVSRVHGGYIKSNTLHEQVRPIIWFYHFLIESGLVNERVNGRLMEYNTKKVRWEVVFNPFRVLSTFRVEFPQKNPQLQQVRDFTYNDPSKRVKNIRLMIDLARHNYKDIAFVLCVMFYGGLRLGESVNLTRQSLHRPKFYDEYDYGEDGFVFLVEDNEKELHNHLKTQANNQVKSQKNFASLEMFDIDLIIKVYKEHKENLKLIENKGKMKNKNALFCSSHKGTPLSYNAAYYQFRKLADLFVNVLIENGDKETLDEITEHNTENIKVHPHLCRAVFTNMGIDLGYTKADLRVRRRDQSEKAQEPYRNQKLIKQKRQIIVNKTQEEALEAYHKRIGEGNK